MMNRPTFSDVYDINPKTGALILGKNRLDDYATKFLNKYCKKALDTPMPLPVNEILKTMKLTVMEASLSRNMDIFGCCLLLDSEVEVFDREEGTSSLVFYPAGTVLLDPASEEMYGEGCAFLCRTVGIDQRILIFHPDYQTNFKYEEDDAYVAALDAILEYDEDEEIELLKMLADPRTTLCQCLWFLMEKRKWKYPDKFSEETGLHKNYHGKIKNDKYNNMGKDVLMAICVALRLKLRLIEKIFDKFSQKLNEYQEPDRTYIHILENFPCISLDDFNGFLRVKNLKELGTTIKE